MTSKATKEIMKTTTETEKVCKRCGILKQASSFNILSQRPKLRPWCKACTYKYTTERFPHQNRKNSRKYAELNPKKVSARMECNRAIKQGRLVKHPCEICGAIKVEAHHEDYSKPLDVKWLCKKHHVEHHFKSKQQTP